MWFSYRKTPLGTAVRDSMMAVIDVYRSREEAEEGLNSLRGRVSAELKILDVGSSDEGLEKLARLDPDLVDIVKNCGGRYAILALWGSAEP